MLHWIDAHCHLHEPWFLHENLPQVIESAKDVGVSEIVNCASNPKNYKQVIESGNFPEISYTLGIQPTLASEFRKVDFYDFFLPYEGDLFNGIGEVGLDYYWEKDCKQREIQRSVFTKIIQVANQLGHRLIIHSRKAESDCLDLLERHAEVPVLLHSFDGNLKETLRAVDLGYKVTIPSNLTIRKNRRKTAKRVPLDNILLETDSPFCAPSPEIERNEPKAIAVAGAALASFLQISVNELAKATTKNAMKFYSL